MNIPYTAAFSLRAAADIREQLEAKRISYLGQINSPGSGENINASWTDDNVSLTTRLWSSNDFCLLYYKYFILCHILIQIEEYLSWQKSGFQGPPNPLTEAELKLIYRLSAGKVCDPDIFTQASKIISDYVTGNEPLPSIKKAPTVKGGAIFLNL